MKTEKKPFNILHIYLLVLNIITTFQLLQILLEVENIFLHSSNVAREKGE
jgi:hypothetical protein